MAGFKAMPLVMAVYRNGQNPVFGEGVTHIEIEDEGAGAFIRLKQSDDRLKEGEVILDLEELQAIANVAQEMAKAYTKATNSDA